MAIPQANPFSITADNQVRAGKCEAIEAVLETMKSHIDDGDVCSNGCGALCNIAIDGKQPNTG